MGRFSSFVASNRAQRAAGGITAVGVAGAGLDGVMTYAGDQAENPENSPLVSAAKGVATGAAWLLAEPLMWGVTLGQGAVGLGKMAYEDAKEQRDLRLSVVNHVREDATGENGGTLSGNFIDNEQAATMRQRQMGLMRQQKMTTESILGSEARQLHR